jgi:hypothetical protein
MNYTPQFDDFVQGLAPNGVTFSISKNYCLNRSSAKDLAALLADLQPTIIYGPPVPNRGSRFQYSQSVPYFKFADGKVRNAGVLATYWVWFNSTLAERCCRADVADDYTGEELLG